MEKISIEELKKRTAGKKITKEQYLAEEIWRYFNKELSFGRIMAIIKKTGWQSIYEIFQEIKKGDVKNRLSLFIYKVKNKTTGVLTR